jgi:hypothetical protein
MAFDINPAFRRFPKEAALIGHLLAAFGELEIQVCALAGQALSQQGLRITVLKTLYGIKATSTRISAADSLMRPVFEKHGLAADYQTAISMLWYCHRTRNQLAHCNWGDHEAAGLFFADLEYSAETPDFDLYWKHIDPPLLELYDQYFWSTLEQLRFIDHELAVKQGRLQSHFWPRPTIPEQPPPHNPPNEHVPPWISESAKALHVARALAAQGGPPTPTPGQQAQDRARAEKKARLEENRRKSEEGERRAKGRSDPPTEES